MKPTTKQLSYLRSLASSRGQTFTMPTTRLEASQEIDRLKRAPKESYRDVRRELHQVADDMATRRGNAASRVGDHEVTGWGSSATWREGTSVSDPTTSPVVTGIAAGAAAGAFAGAAAAMLTKREVKVERWMARGTVYGGFAGIAVELARISTGHALVALAAVPRRAPRGRYAHRMRLDRRHQPLLGIVIAIVAGLVVGFVSSAASWSRSTTTIAIAALAVLLAIGLLLVPDVLRRRSAAHRDRHLHSDP